MPDDTSDDPRQLIADLQRQVAQYTTERDEALAQQAASAEVLQVINSSPGDLAPVFDAMLERAVRLCKLDFALLWTYDGSAFHPVARHRVPDPFWAFLQEHTPPVFARLADGDRLIHIDDVQEDAIAQTDFGREVRRRGLDAIHSVLIVPLRKGEVLLGAINSYRQEVRPFTDKQVALLENFAAQAVIAMENARLITETREALDQQTATAEVLGVINASPGDLAPVFTAILEKAHRLCGVTHGALVLRDGETFRAVATHSYSDAFADQLRQGYRGADNPITQSLLAGAPFVHYPDLAQVDHPMVRASVELAGVRTGLYVPLRKDDVLLGMISSARREIQPFSDNEIALLQNFAAQAVIAMENARLISETREALEQQTATAEVLQVINASPGDLAPVFDAMLEKAMRLCRASVGQVMTYDGERFTYAAERGGTFPLGTSIKPQQGYVLERLVCGEPFVHVTKVFDDPAYRASEHYREWVDRGNVRTFLIAGLRKEDALLGTIGIYSHEEKAFSDKQIALLENFAAQAVIAIENARLITETREALDQQTATAEVLGVINSSPGDLAPVFDAMLEKATRLCEAAAGTFWVLDADRFRAAAIRGMPESFVATARAYQPGPDTPVGRIARGEQLIHLADLAAEDVYRSGDSLVLAGVDRATIRTLLAVPLRKENILLGVFSVYRQEVRPFTDKQIALVQNFAAQAVIAMENARLITETREALDQQTATAEVLQVINSSPGDLVPVFDAILEKAHSLCGIAFGSLQLYEGGKVRAVTVRGAADSLAELLRQPMALMPESLPTRLLGGERFVQIADIAAFADQHPGYPRAQASAEHGLRTALYVALRRDADFLGYITAFRQEVRPFSAKEIALLQNFAAQAVIAMENARLLGETREALEQQTATAEILQVINSSPGNLAPVFEAILEKAHGLCGATLGALLGYDGDQFRALATHGLPEEFAAIIREPFHLHPETPMMRVARGDGPTQVQDLQELLPRLPSDDPIGRAAIEIAGIRTLLMVPLRKDDALLGIITANRLEVRPFSEKEIALLENFAAQAVIAMENARLITETREALEQQTATAEVLQVINSSPGDLAPVFEAMLEKAMRLCEAAFGTLWTYEGDRFRSVAQHGVPAPYAEFLAHNAPVAGAGTGRARILQGERFVHVADLGEEAPYHAGDPHRRALVDLGGARTGLIVPLRKDEAVIGFIMIYRQEVRPFSDKQIALLQNFAAQAVIAMENARLISETREALEQQTATTEVLQVINSSPGDLAPVFDAMLDKATSLCEASFGILWIFDGEFARAGALHQVPEAYAELCRAPFRPSPGSGPARMMQGEDSFAISDLTAYPPYQAGDALTRAIVDLGDARSVAVAPLRRDDITLGAITIYQQEPSPFSDKQIALLENFAAQAVIAMENARLISETREALEQQTATAEVLQVINSSPGNLTPVFDAIVEKALRLCEASFGWLRTYEHDRFKLAAISGVPAQYAEFMAQNEPVFSRGTAPARMLTGERVVHIVDLPNTQEYRTGEPNRRALVDLGGARTLVLVALLKDENLHGFFTFYRQEVRPFSEKQIALLQNFAAQAVIAMENARLITETREALEQQTATSEVLQVINASPGDLAPVFDAMAEKAMRLCDAAFGHLYTYDGELFHFGAAHGDARYVEARRKLGPRRPSSAITWEPIVKGETIVQILDCRDTEAYRDDPRTREAIEFSSIRTLLTVALRKERTLLGVLSIYRQEVRPFSAKQIALLQNFAAQAVIAMENARLITETREALEQQTATAEVLGVINSSPGDLVPVFDAMLEKATRLCDAVFAALLIYDGENFENVAVRNVPEAFAEFARRGRVIPFGPGTGPSRLLAGEPFVHILDGQAEEAYRRADPAQRALVELGGARTWVSMALRKDDALLGIITIFRQEVRPFSDKQIALLQNFAAQAVIAMENARLLGELRARTDEIAGWNRELEARVAAQLAELERTGRLKRFLAPQLAELIVAQGDESILESHRREIVVVFCDLRGFTGFAERAEPEEVMALLRDYHAAMGPIVAAFEGTLDHYAGDGIMVFFNDPLPTPEPARRAIEMAVAMRRAAADLLETWHRLGHDIGFGVGISQGYATLGQIGFAERMDYTAIGTVTNLAARLCAEAQDGQILINRRVATTAGDTVSLEEVGDLSLKGLSQAVAVYNVVP